jgi:hypothetical protein
MKSYKVEIVQTETFIVDVQAEDEGEATDKATMLWDEACESGISHYLQVGDTIMEFGAVYDVTDTDDDVFKK